MSRIGVNDGRTLLLYLPVYQAVFKCKLCLITCIASLVIGCKLYLSLGAKRQRKLSFTLGLIAIIKLYIRRASFGSMASK